jgi:hypothetical protein
MLVLKQLLTFLKPAVPLVRVLVLGNFYNLCKGQVRPYSHMLLKHVENILGTNKTLYLIVSDEDKKV